MTGDAVLYGTLLSVDGTKAQLATIQGTKVEMEVSSDTVENFKQLLKSEVEVKGIATWEQKHEENILIKFEARKITKQEKRPLAEVNKEIKEKFSKNFNKMGNLEHYLKETRGRD